MKDLAEPASPSARTAIGIADSGRDSVARGSGNRRFPGGAFLQRSTSHKFSCDRISIAATFPRLREHACAVSHTRSSLSPAQKSASACASSRFARIAPSACGCGNSVFRIAMEVRKVSDGAAIICSLMGMRVAIGRDLGEHVRVERIAA